MTREQFKDTATAVSLVVIVWSVYFRITRAWWMNDDSYVLSSVISNGILRHFYVPSVDLGIAAANFTPWLFASYGIDFFFFGLDPRGAYLHHLISLSLAAVVLLLAIRLFLARLPAFMMVAGFLVTYSFSVVAQLLCTRHYLEGLVFSAISLLFFAKALERDKLVFSLAGAGFYLLAVSAKEIYTPLVVLLACLLITSPRFSSDCQSWTRKIKYLYPYIAVIAFYILWRAYMLGLGRLLAGYGTQYKKAELRDLITFPLTFLTVQGWTIPLAMMLLTLSLVPFIVYLYDFKSRKEAFQKFTLTATILLLVLLPIFPVMPIALQNPNYCFLVAFMVWLAIGTGLDWCIKTCSKRTAVLVVAAVFSFGVVADLSTFRSSYLWQKDGAIMKRFKTEGKFMLYDSRKGDIVVDHLAQEWYMLNFNKIRVDYLKTEPGADYCGAPCVCLDRAGEHSRILKYEGGEMVEKTKDWLASRCQSQGALK